MKKRTSSPDRILNLVITPLGGLNTQEVLEYSFMVDMVRKEAPKGIERAIRKNQLAATIMEINHSGYFIEIPIRFWTNALNACLEYYTTEEDYNSCIYIKSVLDKVAEYQKIPTTKKQVISKKRREL